MGKIPRHQLLCVGLLHTCRAGNKAGKEQVVTSGRHNTCVLAKTCRLGSHLVEVNYIKRNTKRGQPSISPAFVRPIRIGFLLSIKGDSHPAQETTQM